MNSLTTNKLKLVSSQKKRLRTKVDAYDSNSASVRLLRQERLAADARAAAAESRAEDLLNQLKAVKHVASDLRLQLDTAKNKLEQAASR